MNKKITLLMALTVCFASNAVIAQADTTLLNTLLIGPNSNDELLTLSSGYGGEAAQVVVGNSPVTIDQFGLYGQQMANGNLRFDIFSYDTVAKKGTLVYDSGPVATAAESILQWNNSPIFNLNLNPNTTYYLGVISDQNYTYHWNEPAPEVDGLGLTAPASDGTTRGENGNFRTFANPALYSTAWVQESVQVFGTAPAAVPLPSAIWLFSSALFALLGFYRREN